MQIYGPKQIENNDGYLSFLVKIKTSLQISIPSWTLQRACALDRMQGKWKWKVTVIHVDLETQMI